jgi:hypothetical protein
MVAMQLVRNSALALGALALVGATAVGAHAATSTGGATVDGHYRIASTDCYFGGARCTVVFDVEQSGTRLTSPTDQHFHGSVNGDRIRVGERYPQGTVEDGWIAVGTTTDGGHTFAGTMTDGIGGTGKFVMVFVTP